MPAGGLWAKLQTRAKDIIPVDPTAEKKWPDLFRALTLREGLAAGDRQGTTITLTCEGDGYQANVTLRAYGKTFSVTFYELGQFLGAVDRALADTSTVLRPIRNWRERKQEKT